MNPDFVTGLLIAGIVGAARMFEEGIKWLVKRYWGSKEKELSENTIGVKKLGEDMSLKFAGMANSIVEIRNDIAALRRDFTSEHAKVAMLEKKMEEIETYARNITEALRFIERDHEEMHKRKLNLSEILNHKPLHL